MAVSSCLERKRLDRRDSLRAEAVESAAELQPPQPWRCFLYAIHSRRSRYRHPENCPIYNSCMVTSISHTTEYKQLITELKVRVQSAQIKAARALNVELIELYWHIGREITERQKISGWGDNAIGQIAKDLTRELGGLKGFSRSNLFYMRQLYQYYADHDQIVQQAVGEILWGHNILLFQKLKDPVQALWYAQKTIENGWARSTLQLQIESGLYERQATLSNTNGFTELKSSTDYWGSDHESQRKM